MLLHPGRRQIVYASREIRVINKLGLHARPAAEFVRRANSFRSEIWLRTSTGRYSALSLIEVMRANLECGAVAVLEARGVDAEAALECLVALIAVMPDFD
jgi:phosphocarrier protein